MKAMMLALAVAIAFGSAAPADQPPQRGALMKLCMAEWRAKKAGGEALKYTQFLSECLKRHNSAATAGPVAAARR